MKGELLGRILCSCILLVSLGVKAQNEKDAFNGSRQTVGGGNGAAFNRNRVSNFNDYRQNLNAEYVRLTREKWRDFNSYRGLDLPDKDAKPVSPISMSDEEAKRDRRDNRIEINGMVTPIGNGPQPQPIAPVQEVPDSNPQLFSFSYLATKLYVRLPREGVRKLSGVDEVAVANAWEALCDNRFNNTIIDCIKLRSSRQLCDWAYLMMIKALADACCGRNSNEATLLMAFIYSQSGYKIRLGQCKGKLELLYASLHNVYGVPFFECDGDKFFAVSKISGSIKISGAKYPKERALSLWVNQVPNIEYLATPARELVAKRYPEMAIHVSANKNLLSFFDSYPTSEVGGNFMTRWAMYADTPICKETRAELYAQLKRLLSGYSRLEAVERLLNWVQTAFVYEYDDKVWGCDRAFFSEETLFYPYCDCEDRAILFTRLVRDLLGLRCILIYYPGHLASAVNFSETVNGDYIDVNGDRYVVCDPTYIGASVGRTMPAMDNGKARVIVLP